MAPEDKIKVEGIVIEALPNAMFKVKLADPNSPQRLITAHLSGKLRMNFIRVIPGDRVTVEISVYDLDKGRIILRHKNPIHESPPLR